jgi:hypothetical protein
MVIVHLKMSLTVCPWTVLLTRQNYNSFLLTVACNTVGIYSTTDGRYNVFDYHARNSLGMADPQGTCILLEVQTINEFKESFRLYMIIEMMFYLKLRVYTLKLKHKLKLLRVAMKDQRLSKIGPVTYVNIEDTCDLSAVKHERQLYLSYMHREIAHNLPGEHAKPSVRRM